jgi:hypothetical protein
MNAPNRVRRHARHQVPDPVVELLSAISTRGTLAQGGMGSGGWSSLLSP